MPAPLTFSLKMEFNVAMLLSTSSEYQNPEETRLTDSSSTVIDLIANALSTAHIPTMRKDAIGPKSAVWHISSSAGTIFSYDGYVCRPITLKSPVYYFCPESLEAVALTSRILSKLFHIPTCEQSLRVVIGDGGKSFELSTLQQLSSILWLFEAQLNTLQRSRTQFLSLKRSSRLAASFHDQTSNLTAVECIFSSTSDVELIKLLQPDEDYSGFASPDFSSLRSRRTITFLYPASTLSAENMCNTINTIVGLVDFAKEADGAEFMGWVVREAKRNAREEIGGLKLLRDLGMEELAAFWACGVPGLADWEKEIEDRERFRRRVEAIFEEP